MLVKVDYKPSLVHRGHERGHDMGPWTLFSHLIHCCGKNMEIICFQMQRVCGMNRKLYQRCYFFVYKNREKLTLTPKNAPIFPGRDAMVVVGARGHLRLVMMSVPPY